MNLTQLKLFRDIARELSFVKAAQQNHITQPAVSVHIRKLEEELGKPLFIRAPHNIQLTSEGATILSDVKEILRLCDGLKTRVGYGEGELEGSIRIATVHSIGLYEMGDFLSSFMRSFPKVYIHMEYQRFGDIYDLLLKEKVDLGIVAFPEKRVKVDTIPYGHDELVLIVAKGHALSNRKSITLSQISGEAFIAFDEGVPTREAIDGWFKEQGIQVDVRMTNDNIYALKKAVEADIGISIVPSSSVDEELQKGSLVRIKIRGVNTLRPLALITRKNSRLSLPLEMFINRMLGRDG